MKEILDQDANINPTLKTITFETSELFRIADNGIMIEHWDVVDRGIILDLTQ
jgi:predicted SnoaL-like aldol condensation-catalyzing enzyme